MVKNPYITVLLSFVDNLGKAFLEFVLPLRCVGCGEVGSLVCSRCSAQTDFLGTQYCPSCNQPSILGYTHEACRTRYTPERLITMFPYRGAVRGAIMQLKYEQVLLLRKFLEERIDRYVNEEEFYVPETFTLVPIPLHKIKERKRTFNQSALLAEALAANFNLPIAKDILQRPRPSTSQTKVNKKKRRGNVKGVFEVTAEMDLSHKNILLVDDVWTTGSTAREAVRTLRKAGAREVWVFTLARG